MRRTLLAVLPALLLAPAFASAEAAAPAAVEKAVLAAHDARLGLTEIKNHPNAALDELHLSDEMIEALKSEAFNPRLLCEMEVHPEFIKFLTDAEIYVDGLAAMMTDDLTYTHSSAVTETKAEFLAGLKSGKYLYKEIAPRDRRVRVHGDSAVVSGSAHIVIEPGGQRTEIELYFTELYVKQGGRWKMALWQSTKLPAPAAPAAAK